MMSSMETFEEKGSSSGKLWEGRLGLIGSPKMSTAGCAGGGAEAGPGWVGRIGWPKISRVSAGVAAVC
jgi:hypothetical protein